MRHLIVAILGLLVGTTLAGAALYYNPFTATTAEISSPSDRVLRYSLPDQVLTLALGEHAIFPGRFPAANKLWEETIDHTAVLGLVLDDESGPVAIASRLMAASSATDLLLRGVLVSDYWLVTYPDQGTLFVHSDSNVWPFLKETALPVWLLDRPWRGPVVYRPTVGPGADHMALVVGVSGAFEGREGSAEERYDVTKFDPAQASAAAGAEMSLYLPDTQLAQQ
jgi:hypothetical protein